MDRASRPGRAQNGRHGRSDGAWDATSDARVEALRQRFTEFRRAHKPRTRYPRALRSAVLAALRGGEAEPDVRRACGLTTVQIAAWRQREEVEEPPRRTVEPAAQVFSVVEEIPVSGIHGDVPLAGEDLELRIGGWTVRIRRVEG
jgi:hypothetical protein